MIQIFEYDELYCKIFIDTDIDREAMINLILKILEGTRADWSINSKNTMIELKRNTFFNEQKRSEFPDGFLYSRFFVDVEPNENVLQINYINSIANLLQSLWDLGLKAVAACDFEEELPRKGGYKYIDS